MSLRIPALVLALSLPGIAWAAEVRELAAGAESGCERLAQEVCSTTSLQPAEACTRWHQEQAQAVGADAFVVRDTQESRRMQPSLSGTKMVVTTRMTADYYRCASPATAAAEAPVAPGWSTVEKRLQVLESLKSKGLISADEYQQKRAAILADL